MVPDNSDGIPRVPPYSGAAPVCTGFRVPASHRLRGSVPSPSAIPCISLVRSYNPGTRRNAAGLGSSPFARRYWGNRCYFLLLRVLRCFSSPRSPPQSADDGIAPAGLPHSDICGSMCICHSPQLFAACHVLLRLPEPRHPPCALAVPIISCIMPPTRGHDSENKSDFAFRFARETFVVFLLLSSHQPPLNIEGSCASSLVIVLPDSSPWQI